MDRDEALTAIRSIARNLADEGHSVAAMILRQAADAIEPCPRCSAQPAPSDVVMVPKNLLVEAVNGLRVNASCLDHAECHSEADWAIRMALSFAAALRQGGSTL